MAGRSAGVVRPTPMYDVVAPRWLRVVFATLEWVAPRLGGRLAADIFTTPRSHRTPAWEQAIVSRGRPRVLADGLHTIEWGDPSAPPVVLYHGWEGRGSQLGAFVDPLVASGMHVIALDGPAHGASGGHRAHPVAFADALVAVGKALGPLRAVVAHSMGGAATGIAVDRGLVVDRIALLGTPAAMHEVLERFCSFIGIPPMIHRHMRAALAERTGVQPDDMDVRIIGPRHSLPVLVVHDVADREVPLGDGRVVAGAWANGRYVEVDVGGHRKMLKAGEVIQRVVEFVAERRTDGT